MKKSIPAADPEAYVAGLDGWRRQCVIALRTSVRATARLEERIKWGHLVYAAEEERILFGFRRGKRLREIEPRLKPGGKYEMATLELRRGDAIDPAVVRKLTRTAAVLNRELGDPTDAAPARRRTGKCVHLRRATPQLSSAAKPNARCP